MPNRRVLIVDDSFTIRAMMEQLFQKQRDMSVVAIVSNAQSAKSAIACYRPEVLTLDITMPGMDGLTFLAEIMAEKPVPVVIVSSQTNRDCETARRAMALGAAACFDKARIISDSADFMKTVRQARIGTLAAP